MALLKRYDPPAFLPDFNAIPGQLEAWHHAVSVWFDAVIAIEMKKHSGNPVQFYNAAGFDPGGVAVEQAITWNAFPKELLRRFGRDRALLLADKLWPLERYRAPASNPDAPLNKPGTVSLYRPQEEYCEWHVLREPDSDKIQRVTFTSEPPEYWQALYGEVPGGGGIPDQIFPGDPDVLLSLYRELVSPEVQLDDLLMTPDPPSRGKKASKVPKKIYNIYNKWNTTHGIAHLNSPPNSLVAEIQLGGDASLHYLDPQGRVLVEPDALISYANYGGANRNSDPTIGASVNALARLGAFVTLRNPVGLYMDHIDLSGWEAPDKKSLSDCVRIIRGTPGMIERQVVEVPRQRGFQVGDITINGIPIRFGGQIAECITVKLIAVANIVPKAVPVYPITTQAVGVIDPFNASVLSGARSEKTILPGYVQAFRGQGTIEMANTATPNSRIKSMRSQAGPVHLVNRRAHIPH